MYLEHFKLNTLPFTLTPNTGFYCNLPGHQAALNVLLVSLRAGEGFIKITGEVGSGKTLLCRLLLEKLDPEFVTAYIPNPDLTPSGLRSAVALELGITPPLPADQHRLLTIISEKLITLHKQNKRTVLLIDEAQTLSFESLEAIRLLTNLETETTKLLQVVLFGQPELDTKIKKTDLRQLQQRITFSYYLPQLSREELEAYLCHRLTMAGYTMGTPFTKKALHLIHTKSRGIPRLINILAHKSMMASFGKNETKVDRRSVITAIKDTDSVKNVLVYNKKLIWFSLSTFMMILGILFVVR
ncbi:MAG: AAA family ATPase [Gammaproteobacteria bacterium]|nr:AAA family ATPase [Gammaproteobacteria bacterium]